MKTFGHCTSAGVLRIASTSLVAGPDPAVFTGSATAAAGPEVFIATAVATRARSVTACCQLLGLAIGLDSEEEEGALCSCLLPGRHIAQATVSHFPHSFHTSPLSASQYFLHWGSHVRTAVADWRPLT